MLLFAAVVPLLMLRRVRYFSFMLLGFALFTQAGNGIVDARLEARFAGDSLLTQVRIADFPKVSGASVSLLLEPIKDRRIPPRTRVTWFDPPAIPEFGEIWEFELRLRRPRGASNPGVFSVSNWMFREKLHAAGYIVSGKRNRMLEEGQLSPLEKYRRNFVARATRADPDAAPLLAAIAVGSRHLITRDQWDRFARTGTSHLMAISGLHIGLAAAAAFVCVALFCGACRLRGNYLDHATIAATGMAASYAWVAGFAVPSQRATVMLVLAAIAFLCRRRAEPGRIVALVAVLVFVIDPVSLMMPGFALSFGAVIILLWFAQYYWRPRAGLRFWQLAAMQCMLLLGLMPLTIPVFQRIAFVAPMVNFITVPVFSFITVPLTLASMLLQPLWDAASLVLLRMAAFSIRGVVWLIGVFAEMPGADVLIAGVDGIGGAVMCFVLLPALWVVLPRGWPGRRVALLAVLAVVLNKPAAPDHGCVDAHFLDVGQGLAVVIQSAKSTLIFDTGASFRGGGSAAAQVVLPFLRYKGIDSIDWLVVSHADDDHAGGMAALMENLVIGRIFSGESLPGSGREILACEAGNSWHADGIEFRFLHPAPGHSFEGNDASCVLSVSAGEYHLILTGDIEVAGEQSVLLRVAFETASVVLIPHHGSLTSSSPPFVNRLRPDLAIASVGHANRWGFPKQRVVSRWEGGGAVVLDTASSGAISLRLCATGGVSRLREERHRQRRFWHDSATL